MNKWMSIVPAVSAALFLTACVTNQQEVKHTKRTSAPPKILNLGSATVRVSPEFKADAPNKYVVRKGDSLWKIASMFLQNPGRWKEVWMANPQIKNPNRIYPGDVLAVKNVKGIKRVFVTKRSSNKGKYTGRRTASGLKIYDVNPAVVNTSLAEPVPTFPISAIAPFIDKNLIVDANFENELGYIVGDSSNTYLSLTSRSVVYAKGDFNQKSYRVYRREGEVKDPFSGSVLAHEANYIGEVIKIREASEDGISTFKPVERYRPLMPEDVLVEKEEGLKSKPLAILPSLYSGNEENIYVIKPLGQNISGVQFDTLLIRGGKDQGIEEGHVFSIVRGTVPEGVGRGGETFTLPDYEVGIGMIYKVQENMSYLLVMNATDVIYPKDRLVVPPK